MNYHEFKEIYVRVSLFGFVVYYYSQGRAWDTWFLGGLLRCACASGFFR